MCIKWHISTILSSLLYIILPEIVVSVHMFIHLIITI